MQHKTPIQRSKGFRGRANNCFSIANERSAKSLTYAYRDRRTKRRFFRSLAIQRLNSSLRYSVPSLNPTTLLNAGSHQTHGISYSVFIPLLRKAQIKLNRHILSNLASTEPRTFQSIVQCCSLVKSSI